MVQFEYDGVMKRYNVKVPFTLAGESSMVTIAAISENNRITLRRELSIKLLQQVLLSWDEHEHMETMRVEREAGEFDSYFDDDEPKSKELTFLEERLQIPGRGERTDAWKDISLNSPQTGNRITIHQTKYLKFSSRAYHVLWSAGINTLGELVEKSERDMFRIKNCGRKTLTEIQEKLREIGLTLKQTDEIERRQYGI